MNKIKVKIEIWESKDGFSPYTDSFKSIKDERTKDRIIKKIGFLRNLSLGS